MPIRATLAIGSSVPDQLAYSSSIVEGDMHDIGKNLIKMLLEGSGFKVIDLGRDVPLDKFVEVARKEKADIIAASTLMTIASMEDLMKILKEQGVRDQFKVLIGGAATDPAFAEEIGADAWGKDASEAVGSLANSSSKGGGKMSIIPPTDQEWLTSGLRRAGALFQGQKIDRVPANPIIMGHAALIHNRTLYDYYTKPALGVELNLNAL
ncbi:MAG: cobalamin-dependent protein [Nitrososphaerota archaeon]